MTLNLTLTYLFFDSMHDNRWEGEKEEDKEKEDKTKRGEEKPKKKEKEEEKAKPPTSQKVKGGSSGILMQVTLLVM